MPCLRNLKLLLCATLALASVAGQASAELLTFDVVPAYAPKGTESPSWSNYVLNAISGIQMSMDIGDRSSDPTAYERVSGDVPAEEMIYTPFNSWRGKADPNAEFVAPFLGEYGNRVHFGLRIVGEKDWDFRLEDLTWELDSDDAGGYFDQSGDLSGSTYSATRIGIHYGPDGVKGGGDDTIITDGPGTQSVHELIYVGIGDGFFSFDPLAESDQADINQTLYDLRAGCGDPEGCLINLNATYTLPNEAGGYVSASGDVDIFVVPEPVSSLLGGVGIALSLAVLRRRRR